jgi:hypothetical protein
MSNLEVITMTIKQLVHTVQEIYEEHGGAEESLLEFHWDKENNLGTLSANRAGFLLLARELVTLAASDVKGKHIHMDECSFFPKGSDAIVIERADL